MADLGDLAQGEPPVIDPYEVLGLERSATDEQIKSAYRKQALKNHPGKAALYFPALERSSAFLKTAIADVSLSVAQTRLPKPIKKVRRLSSKRSPLPMPSYRIQLAGSATTRQARPRRPSSMRTDLVGPTSTGSSSATPSRPTPSASSPRSTRARTRRRTTCWRPTRSTRATWTASTSR